MGQERGERGGVVLDGPAEGEMPSGEEGDAALTTIEAPNETVNEPTGDADPNRGTEDPQAGKDGQGQEGEVQPEGEGAGTPADERLSVVEKTLQDIHAKLNEKPPEAPPAPITEEQWAKMEQEWGVPRTAIERSTQQAAKVYSKIMEQLESRLARFEFGDALNDFSKTPGFQDATRYKKDVQDFMNAYEPKHWSNPELIKRGVIYARGIHASTNIQKARTDSERNRKIAGPGRPAAPSSNGSRTSLPPLNQSQKEAAALMGSESEYNKFRPKGGRVILE